MYLAPRPKPMRRDVMWRRCRARSYVRLAMFTDFALASTSAATRSPAASSARSHGTAVAIFVWLGASAWSESLEALTCCREIRSADGEYLGGETAPTVFCRSAIRSDSKSPGLEMGIGGLTANAAARPDLWFGSRGCAQPTELTAVAGS
jgi:hypothetical protein